MRVLSEEALVDVGPGLAEPSWKFLRWLLQETGVSVSVPWVQAAQNMLLMKR